MVNHNVHHLFTIIFLIIISPILGWQLNEPYAGSFSFYNEVRFGLCVGKLTDAENDFLVAISYKLWSKNVVISKDPLCHVCLKVDYNGKCITVPVRDVCHEYECSATHAILSKPAFEKLESLSVGSVQNATLTFVKCDGVVDGNKKK
ncbi:unnamed protein product [Meloidogyne enterolobii]|uniref:Uncharacterized protein n=1 Tax=Meloidogyne enterolobii TaxID=390850 RepID=A0ACB0YW39_MELEN